MNVNYGCCVLSFTAIEVGPQPHGVVRADIYNYMKEALDLAIEWIGLFNSGTKISRHHNKPCFQICWDGIGRKRG